MILENMTKLSAATGILVLALGILVWIAIKNWFFPRTRGRFITNIYPKVIMRPISVKYECPRPQPLIRRKNYLFNKTDFEGLFAEICAYLDLRICKSARITALRSNCQKIQPYLQKMSRFFNLHFLMRMQDWVFHNPARKKGRKRVTG